MEAKKITRSLYFSYLLLLFFFKKKTKKGENGNSTDAENLERDPFSQGQTLTNKQGG
jgi:hypothetical protein